MNDSENNMNNIIEVKSLGKKFGDLEAVKNISFEVKEREIFGFLGRKILWKRKKNAVLEKKEEQVMTAENLMTQIIKNLNAEMTRIEEPAKIEENPRNNISFQSK
ncbi:hypothetical protein ES705_48921 [subsurface metagenome]